MDIDLFLSNEGRDVQAVVAAGAAAAKLGVVPEAAQERFEGEVRIAFDGDALVFSPESDQIYLDKGLSGFVAHERANARNPMKVGPLGGFLKKL